MAKENTLKILLVSEYFPPKIFGGGEISAWLLAKNLAKVGDMDISVLTSHFPELKKFEEKEGVKIYRNLETGETPSSAGGSFSRRTRFPSSLKKELERISANYDVIHFLNTSSIIEVKTKAKKVATINSYGNFCPKSNLFYKEKGVCEGCNFSKFIPCLLSSGYMGKVKLRWYLKYNPFFWLVSYQNYKKRKNALSSIDQFIAISEFTKEQLLRGGVLEKKIEKIPNLVEIREAKEEYPLEKNGVKVTYLGVLEKIKGVSLLIRAFNEIKVKATLLIVGEGSERKNLEKLADDRVRFLGKVNYGVTSSIYQQSDIIVLPSLWPEPLSRVLLEALYFGNPIIATKVGGNLECIVEGENGFLVNPKVREIQEKLESLSKNKELREKMGKKGKELFQRKFNSEKIIKNIRKFYAGVVKGN